MSWRSRPRFPSKTTRYNYNYILRHFYNNNICGTEVRAIAFVMERPDYRGSKHCSRRFLCLFTLTAGEEANVVLHRACSATTEFSLLLGPEVSLLCSNAIRKWAAGNNAHNMLRPQHGNSTTFRWVKKYSLTTTDCSNNPAKLLNNGQNCFHRQRDEPGRPKIICCIWEIEAKSG